MNFLGSVLFKGQYQKYNSICIDCFTYPRIYSEIYNGTFCAVQSIFFVNFKPIKFIDYVHPFFLSLRETNTYCKEENTI